MMLQTALLKKTLPEDKRDDLRVMEEEIGRLDHLTKRISEFLRNPAGSPEIIELKSFVQDLVQRFDAGIAFSPAECPDADIFIDRERFRSVLENLMKNALESAQESGRNPQVSVEIFRSHNDHWVSVDVLDRGDGLPAGDMKTLFDPFFTTKVHGSGIGLAISLRFIEAAGGTLELSSRESGGTRARVTLPVHAEDQKLKKSRRSLKKRLGRSWSGKSREASK
jgi:two-component system sensor histidine kinase HydH